MLDSEEREKVLTILEGVVRMTPKERETLSNVLSITELSKITNLVKLLEERYRVYYALKEAVFNSELGVKEVPDLQRMSETSFSINASNMSWIFLLVGQKFNSSGYIEGEIDTNSHHGESSLIFKNSTKPSYKIYVKKWSEIFADFELRHKFLCNKLELKRERLLANAKTKEDLHDIIDAAQTHLK